LLVERRFLLAGRRFFRVSPRFTPALPLFESKSTRGELEERLNRLRAGRFALVWTRGEPEFRLGEREWRRYEEELPLCEDELPRCEEELPPFDLDEPRPEPQGSPGERESPLSPVEATLEGLVSTRNEDVAPLGERPAPRFVEE
jgi:hypothetical protein